MVIARVVSRFVRRSTSLPRTVIVADDLTGALDAAAPFGALGWRTLVAATPADVDLALSHAPDVLSVSTNAREAPERDAVAAMLAVALKLGSAPIMFKKVDSRLKGHVRAELVALAELRGAASVLLCPAIPEFGRIVRDGAISGFGVAVPISCAALAQDADPAIMVADAVTEADLDSLVARALRANHLLAGARGLAAALARSGGEGPNGDGRFRLCAPAAFGVGSRDPVTLAQVDHLRASRPNLPVAAAPNGIAAGPPQDSSLVVLQVRDGPQGADPAAVERAFAGSFAPAFSDGRRTLLLTGGATAAAVLARLGIGVLDVLGEAAPGIPVSRPVVFGAEFAELHVVTKSGGFGAASALADLADLISGPTEAAGDGLRMTGR